MILYLTLLICAGFSLGHDEGKRLDLINDSLLLYLDKLANTSPDNFSKECNNKLYASTIYNRMVYFHFCEKHSESSNKTFLKFCSSLAQYQSGSSDKKNVNFIDSVAESHQIFGFGIPTDQYWLAHRSCLYIADYFEQKELLQRNFSDSGDGIKLRPNYTEWFVFSLPFTLTFSCGFTEYTFYNRSPYPSIYDCMAPSSKGALYVMLILDSCIVLAIVIANVIILLVTPKMKIASAPHG